MRRVMSLIIALTILIASLLPAGVSWAEAENVPPGKPAGLMVDLLSKPLGIENDQPKFSWIVNDADNNEVQTAYQILVASSEDNINNDNGDVWDSGKIISDESSAVPYNGPELQADSIYYWKVRTWDKNDAVGPYSEPQMFSTAVKGNWVADTIWASVPNNFQQTGWDNYIIETDFTIKATAAGIIFRAQDNKNFYMWQIRAGSPASLKKHKCVNGTYTAYDSSTSPGDAGGVISADINLNEKYYLRIEVNGNVYKTYIGKTKDDAVLVDTFTDTELLYLSGVIGFRTGGSEQCTFDNVKVTNIDSNTVIYQNDFSDGADKFPGASLVDGELFIDKSRTIIYSFNTNWDNYAIETDFTIKATAAGIIFRAQDNKNFYMWQIRAGSPASLKKHKCVNGTYTAYDSTTDAGDAGGAISTNINLNEKYYLRIEAKGNVYKTYIGKTKEDAALVDTFTDTESLYMKGVIGFRTGGSEQCTFDNIKVTNLDSNFVIYQDDFSDGADKFPGASLVDGELFIDRSKTILFDNAEKKYEFVFLRKSFTLPDKDITRAIASVTALDPDPGRQYVYRLYINGSFVGVGPERSYNNITRYNTYDVTDLLKRNSENVVAALNYTTNQKKFLFQMKVYYSDGSSEIIKSDKTWKSLDGTKVFNSDGSIGTSYYYAPNENIDARVYPFGWNNTGFDDSSWDTVEVKAPISNLKASSVENAKLYVLEPVKVVNKGNNNYFIDFGKEVLAGLRLEIDGVDGAKIELREGEQLSGENTVKYNMLTGNKYQEYWTLKNGYQVLENWGFREFRYAEILNCPVPITKDNIKALVLRNEFNDSDSSFESSEELLNRIWDLCKYSIKATNFQMYVDTFTRERGVYEGDAYINALSSYGVERSYALARYTSEYLYYVPTWPTEYKPFSIMTAYQDYMYTGNKVSLIEHYNLLKSKKTLEEYKDPNSNLVKKNATNDLVDWPAGERDGFVFPDGSSPYKNSVVNAFYYKALKDMAAIAEAVGNTADAESYRNKAQLVKEEINSTFYNAEDKAFNDTDLSTHHSIHANAFPLAFDAVSDEYKSDIANFVASTGMKGSVYFAQFYMDALYNAEMGDKVLEWLLSSSGLRNYKHMMDGLGATITTEAWDPSLKSNMSFSHPWAASPANTIPRGMFGIVPIEPAFRTFQIKPQIGSLSYANIKVPTIRGYIEVNASQDSGHFAMTVNIPVNTKAQVYVPVSDEGRAYVSMDGKVVKGTLEGKYVRIDNVGSGTHTFSNAVGEVITDVEVKTDAVSQKVTVQGKISSGANKKVTIRVTRPDGEIDYVDQTVSGEDGIFSFTFSPDKWIEGIFGLEIGGERVNVPYSGEFQLDKLPENNPPVFDPIENKIVQKGEQLTFTVSATDADRDKLTYSAIGLPDGATFNAESGVFSWTPSKAGIYEIIFTVSDGRGGTDSQTVRITVKDVVVPATIGNVKIDVDKAAGKVTVEGVISSGAGKEVTIVVKSPSGSYDYIDQITSGDGGAFKFIYTPSELVDGEYKVKIGGEGVQTPYEGSFTVETEIPNNPPVLTPIENKIVRKGQSLTFTVSATDADGDKLTYSAIGLPDGATFNAETGVFSWTPSKAGIYEIIFTVSDGRGGYDSQTVRITVKEVVVPAVIENVKIDVDKAVGKVTVEGVISSGAGKEVTIAVKSPSGSYDYIDQITSGDGGAFKFIYTPSELVDGEYKVKIGGEGVQTPYEGSFTVETEIPNNPPKLNPIENKIVRKGQQLTFTVSATDTDGDKLTYSAIGLPDGATFNAETGVFSWTPAKAGIYEIIFTVSDGRGGTDSQTVRITVKDGAIIPAIIENVKIDVDRAGRKVTIQGVISSGSGKEVTITVKNPSGHYDYIDQTTSGDGGIFRFIYTLSELVYGEYSVRIGGEGVDTPYEGRFTIKRDTTGGGSYIPVIDTEEDATEIEAEHEKDSKYTARFGKGALRKAIEEAEDGIARLKVTGTEEAGEILVNIPAEDLELTIEKGIETIEIVLDDVVFSINPEVLINSKGQYPSNIEFSVKKVDVSSLPEEVRNVVGNSTVYDLTLSVDGEKISFNKGDVTISMKYTLKPGEDPNKVVV
ncbi:MAG TPA: family 78 glycoside hydrolase catalytic domain, partial [Clostridiaceae bacterium]|nr:family 78 glycoside hydrolase catalytic domain [Clostridiaceae bacterium]